MAQLNDEQVPPYDPYRDRADECIEALQKNTDADRSFRMPGSALRLVDPVTTEVFRMVPGSPPTRILTGFVKGKRKPITIELELRTVPADMLCKSEKALTAFDHEVFLAVCSILNAGNQEFTLRQIYHVMTGGARAGAGSLTAIEESLLMLKSVWLVLTPHEQTAFGAEQRNQKDSCAPILDTIAVSTDKPGSRISRYRIGMWPELLRYAKEHRQFTSAELFLLAIPGVSNTKETICIRGYLLQRVLGMKNRRNHLKSDQILFETLFRECGINDCFKDVRSRRREIIRRILVFWQSEGFIADFEFEREECRSHHYRSIRIQCKRKPR